MLHEGTAGIEEEGFEWYGERGGIVMCVGEGECVEEFNFGLGI